MGLYFWGRSIQEMGGNVLIGCSIYGVVVIDGSLYSRLYGISNSGMALPAQGSTIFQLMSSKEVLS